jgi:hypothetical protein
MHVLTSTKDYEKEFPVSKPGLLSNWNVYLE